MNELALFAGAGGGILGGHLLGWRTVCAVEFDPYARECLIRRQNDGFLRPFPIWDDVRTFDGYPWQGRVDVVSGGFPCQDISAAGKGAGIDGERSGLWREMARIVGEVRPAYVWVENSPMLVSRGLAVVLGDLAALGYDAVWGVVGAHHAGAPHKRDRIWILANAVSSGERRVKRENENEGDAKRVLAYSRHLLRRGRPESVEQEPAKASDGHQNMVNAYGPRLERADNHVQASGGISGMPPESGDAKGRMADADGFRELQSQGGKQNQRGRPSDGCEKLANPNGIGLAGSRECQHAINSAENGEGQANQPFHESPIRGAWWATEPDMGRVADGMATWVDPHGANAIGDVGRVGTSIPNRAGRLKAIGNGQCPAALVLAWNTLVASIKTD